MKRRDRSQTYHVYTFDSDASQGDWRLNSGRGLNVGWHPPQPVTNHWADWQRAENPLYDLSTSTLLPVCPALVRESLASRISLVTLDKELEGAIQRCVIDPHAAAEASAPHGDKESFWRALGLPSSSQTGSEGAWGAFEVEGEAEEEGEGEAFGSAARPVGAGGLRKSESRGEVAEGGGGSGGGGKGKTTAMLSCSDWGYASQFVTHASTSETASGNGSRASSSSSSSSSAAAAASAVAEAGSLSLGQVLHPPLKTSRLSTGMLVTAIQNASAEAAGAVSSALRSALPDSISMASLLPEHFNERLAAYVSALVSEGAASALIAVASGGAPATALLPQALQQQQQQQEPLPAALLRGGPRSVTVPAGRGGLAPRTRFSPFSRPLPTAFLDASEGELRALQDAQEDDSVAGLQGKALVRDRNNVFRPAELLGEMVLLTTVSLLESAAEALAVGPCQGSASASSRSSNSSSAGGSCLWEDALGELKASAAPNRGSAGRGSSGGGGSFDAASTAAFSARVIGLLLGTAPDSLEGWQALEGACAMGSPASTEAFAALCKRALASGGQAMGKPPPPTASAPTAVAAGDSALLDSALLPPPARPFSLGEVLGTSTGEAAHYALGLYLNVMQPGGRGPSLAAASLEARAGFAAAPGGRDGSSSGGGSSKRALALLRLHGPLRARLPGVLHRIALDGTFSRPPRAVEEDARVRLQAILPPSLTALVGSLASLGFVASSHSSGAAPLSPRSAASNLEKVLQLSPKQLTDLHSLLGRELPQGSARSTSTGSSASASVAPLGRASLAATVVSAVACSQGLAGAAGKYFSSTRQWHAETLASASSAAAAAAAPAPAPAASSQPRTKLASTGAAAAAKLYTFGLNTASSNTHSRLCPILAHVSPALPFLSKERLCQYLASQPLCTALGPSPEGGWLGGDAARQRLALLPGLLVDAGDFACVTEAVGVASAGASGGSSGGGTSWAIGMDLNAWVEEWCEARGAVLEQRAASRSRA